MEFSNRDWDHKCLAWDVFGQFFPLSVLRLAKNPPGQDSVLHSIVTLVTPRHLILLTRHSRVLRLRPSHSEEQGSHEAHGEKLESSVGNQKEKMNCIGQIKGNGL